VLTHRMQERSNTGAIPPYEMLLKRLEQICVSDLQPGLAPQKWVPEQI
jgi:hypothetical protein